MFAPNKFHTFHVKNPLFLFGFSYVASWEESILLVRFCIWWDIYLFDSLMHLHMNLAFFSTLHLVENPFFLLADFLHCPGEESIFSIYSFPTLHMERTSLFLLIVFLHCDCWGIHSFYSLFSYIAPDEESILSINCFPTLHLVRIPVVPFSFLLHCLCWIIQYLYARFFLLQVCEK